MFYFYRHFKSTPFHTVHSSFISFHFSVSSCRFNGVRLLACYSEAENWRGVDSTQNDMISMPPYADPNTNKPPNNPGQPLLDLGSPPIGNLYNTHGQTVSPPYNPSYPPPFTPSPHQQQQQQQQQSVVVINSGGANNDPVESYCGYQAFACIVLWFCNVLFGFIAWILARESFILHVHFH